LRAAKGGTWELVRKTRFSARQNGDYMTNVLEVKDLCKTYIVNKRQNNVLRNVNFTISEGEMVAVMGPSGSGKSTLLYSVSGMDQITAGKVTFYGNDLEGLSPKKLTGLRLDDMGFIFQQMYMLRNLTVLDNIILPACQSKKHHESRKACVDRGQELMKKLGIIEIADNDITEVSGGQLQRACICRSLINNPKMIFADEPTGALNRTSSDEVMKELLKINEEGTSIMLVTHDVKVAAQCSRIIYIVDGNIKGEYHLDRYSDVNSLKNRERVLNDWLMEMGW
jgi:putative ABC transport system ATP-binding protein